MKTLHRIVRLGQSVVVLALFLQCGCALVYVGKLKAADDAHAIQTSKVLEAAYATHGLEQVLLSYDPTPFLYSTRWYTSQYSCLYRSVSVGNDVKDGTLFIRIVPAPNCNKASRDFAAFLEAFSATNFPGMHLVLQSNLVLDLFR